MSLYFKGQIVCVRFVLHKEKENINCKCARLRFLKSSFYVRLLDTEVLVKYRPHKTLNIYKKLNAFRSRPFHAKQLNLGLQNWKGFELKSILAARAIKVWKFLWNCVVLPLMYSCWFDIGRVPRNLKNTMALYKMFKPARQVQIWLWDLEYWACEIPMLNRTCFFFTLSIAFFRASD